MKSSLSLNLGLEIFASSKLVYFCFPLTFYALTSEMEDFDPWMCDWIWLFWSVADFYFYFYDIKFK